MQHLSSHNIAAEEADRRIGRNFFDRFTRNVQCFGASTHFEGDFDLLERAEKNGEVECLLFEQDLRINGCMRLSAGVQSIIVVLGDLHIHALELGDAMLAVTGTVEARDYICAPPNEGVLETGSAVRKQPIIGAPCESLPDLTSLRAPVFVFYDFEQQRHRIFYTKSRNPHGLIELPEPDWPSTLDHSLFTPSGLNHAPVLKRLRQGIPLGTF